MPRAKVQELPKVAISDDFDVASAPVLAVTISDALRITGIGRTSLYEAISDGRIEAAKAGQRTLVIMDSLRTFIGTLPRISRPAEVSAATRVRHA